MKNLFTQNQNLENNTRFVWNVEVQHYAETTESVGETADKMELSKLVETHESVYKAKMDKINADEASDIIKNPPIEEPADLYPKEETVLASKTEKKENLGQRFARMLGWKKEEDNGALSKENIEQVEPALNGEVVKPDTTAIANNNKAEKEKEAVEIDPVKSIEGFFDNIPKDDYLVERNEAETTNETQGGGIGGMNIAKAESPFGETLESGNWTAEGGRLGDSDNIT